MLTRKSKYAIKAVVALARNGSADSPVRISDLSEQENIPRKFLEAILLDLRRQGILGSRLGANGGYYLVQPPDEIMLSRLMRLTDGPIALLPCVSLNFYESCGECTDERTCGLRDVAIDVRDASLRILNNTSIADLIAREKKLASRKTKKK